MTSPQSLNPDTPGGELGALARNRPQTGTQVPRPRNRWRTRVLIPLAILLAIGGLAWYAAREVIFPPTPVRVVPVIVRDARENATTSGETKSPLGGPSVQAPGWIEPEPYAINVPALVDGIIRDVLVLEGDTVTEGQIVAHLIDDDLRLAERSAQAVVAERQADVAKARAGVAPMRSAIQIASAEADMIRDEMDRKRGLVESGGVPAGDYARLEIRLRSAQARVEQAKSELTATEATAAQAAAALATAQAGLAEIQLRLARTEVRSPAAGTVLSRLVAPGSRIAVTSRSAESMDTTATVLRLYDPDHLQVRADVPLADASRIGVGTVAEITTEAIPNVKFQGTVSRLMQEANIQRNTVQFKVAIEQPSRQLKPEMLARVRFNPASKGSIGGTGGTPSENPGFELLLPASVFVNRTEGKAQVWIAQAGAAPGHGVAALRDVMLGGERETDLIIATGVKPGDRAIVAPPATLRTGDRVRIVGEVEANGARTP